MFFDKLIWTPVVYAGGCEKMSALAEIYFTVFNVWTESIHECYMSPDSGCVDK